MNSFFRGNLEVLMDDQVLEILTFQTCISQYVIFLADGTITVSLFFHAHNSQLVPKFPTSTCSQLTTESF